MMPVPTSARTISAPGIPATLHYPAPSLSRGHSLRLTAEVSNIFDQQYEVVRSYPMPGAHAKVKIEYTPMRVLRIRHLLLSLLAGATVPSLLLSQGG